MKNHLIISIFLFTIIFSLKSIGEVKKGMWEFVKDDDYCLIQSAPVKTLIPEGKSRGKNYILVYRMNKNQNLSKNNKVIKLPMYKSCKNRYITN